MTKEKIKTFLLQLNTDKQLNSSEHEAIREAIKIIEQQCDDCISRAEVIKYLDSTINRYKEEKVKAVTWAIKENISKMKPVIPMCKNSEGDKIDEFNV